MTELTSGGAAAAYVVSGFSRTMDSARGRAAAATIQPAPCSNLRRVRKRPLADLSPVRSRLISSTPVVRLKNCEHITFNAETAETAEKKCPKISQRALRALRSNVAFFRGPEGGHSVGVRHRFQRRRLTVTNFRSVI